MPPVIFIFLNPAFITFPQSILIRNLKFYLTFNHYVKKLRTKTQEKPTPLCYDVRTYFEKLIQNDNSRNFYFRTFSISPKAQFVIKPNASWSFACNLDICFRIQKRPYFTISPISLFQRRICGHLASQVSRAPTKLKVIPTSRAVQVYDFSGKK